MSKLFRESSWFYWETQTRSKDGLWLERPRQKRMKRNQISTKHVKSLSDSTDTDLPFSHKSVVSKTHEQNSICSLTIICRQLFVGHMVGSRRMKRKEKIHRTIIAVEYWHHYFLILNISIAVVLALFCVNLSGWMDVFVHYDYWRQCIVINSSKSIGLCL